MSKVWDSILFANITPHSEASIQRVLEGSDILSIARKAKIKAKLQVKEIKKKKYVSPKMYKKK